MEAIDHKQGGNASINFGGMSLGDMDDIADYFAYSYNDSRIFSSILLLVPDAPQCRAYNTVAVSAFHWFHCDLNTGRFIMPNGGYCPS